MLRSFTKTPLAIALSAVALPLAQPAFAQMSEKLAVEEVVVTAQRRSESLQEVPLAVTALTGEELAMRGLADIGELAQSVPSLTLEPSRATNTTLTAFMRGVGQQDPLAGFEQGVAIYIDDVYLARPQAALLDIYDVERIEVLRGPQGTLYGRNAVGGAVKYVTRRLGDELDVRVRAGLGNFNQRDFVATASVPISDDFRVGGTVGSFQRAGYGENLFTGGEQYNKDLVGMRLSFEWDVSENISVRGSYDETEDNSAAVAGHRPFPANTIDAPSPSSVWDTRAGASEPSVGTTTGINGNNRVDAKGWNITVDWALNDEWTLRSITADREDYTESVIDFDSLPVPDFDAPVIYDNEQFTQEFQALWNTDRFKGVFGVYYQDSTAANDFDVVLGQLGVTAYTGGVVDTKAWSVFGDVTYDVTEKLSVALGLRYTDDTRSADIFRGTYLGLQSPFFGNAAAFELAVTSDYEAEQTYTDTSPRINVSYALNEDVNLYVNYSEGWKAGSFDPRGANFATPEVEAGFDPEQLNSYEMGFKSTWLDGRAVTNVAVFWSEYSDMQIPGSVGVDSDGDGVNDSFVGTVTNAGKAEISGIEIEGSVVLTENWSTQFAASFLDASFDEFIVNGVNVADQREMQNTPEQMVFAALNYDTEIAGGSTRFSVNYSYKGDVTQFEIANPEIDQDAVGVFNANIFWTSPSEKWRLGLFGKNLTDEEIRVSGYCFGAGTGPENACPSALGLENNTTVFYAAPRTITGTVQYQF
jgi:iron complex outermembrane receptor protein